ncbi:MAG: TetR/AcrR family transcriptional regulator [Nocardioidaceae bacterium]
MGRPREHDEATAAALLEAAERAVEAEGLAALSVRGVANDVGTTTRAVYSLFGSKDGLVVALGAHAFDLLGAAVAALPETDDPAADLVQAGLVFRRFAREHPALFTVGVQRALPSRELWDRFRGAANRALSALHARLDRLAARDGLGARSVAEAASQFHALCEGLAAAELRDPGVGRDPEARWRAALDALVRGFAVAPVASEGREAGAPAGGATRRRA